MPFTASFLCWCRAVPRTAPLVLVLLTTACIDIELPNNNNPFNGTWATAERQQIGFGPDTIMITAPNEPPTPMNAASCDGTFRFAYSRKSRDALLALTPRQPDLKSKLTTMLAQPDYDVAEVNCGEGYSAYVLLDDRDVVVIHRDRDIAGIEQLTRL
ncbi:MAG TPA: hypothetical protein VHY35_03335 [Stellaceae bacterium]|nr:hypothetical protein [Stellaceae bacterium]